MKNHGGSNSLPEFVIIDADHDRLRYFWMTEDFFFDIQSRDLVTTRLDYCRKLDLDQLRRLTSGRWKQERKWVAHCQ
jgi:hypothetical protein